jgi:hypothetical protein
MLAIEPRVLKKARALAARRGQSLSALLADKLRALMDDDARYRSAHKRARSFFENPLSLGAGPLRREELHERRRFR